MTALARQDCPTCGETTLHRSGVCIHCGHAIEHAPVKQLKAYGTYRIAPLKNRGVRRCQNCGKPFHSENKRTRCCGRSCAQRLKAKERGLKRCPVCGQEKAPGRFQPNGYCTPCDRARLKQYDATRPERRRAQREIAA